MKKNISTNSPRVVRKAGTATGWLLRNRLYRIIRQTRLAKGWECRLSLNASHPVYRAHFPGYPVTPGVCIVQLAKEVVTVCHAKPFFLRGMKHVKFLRILQPDRHEKVSVRLQLKETDAEGCEVVAVSVRDGAEVFATMTLLLAPVAQQPLLQDRMERLRLCMLIPTYNNAGTLGATLDAVLRHTRSVVVVNDGSTDGTAELLARYAGRGVEVVTCTPNRGKGYALRQGFARARALGCEAVVTMDSDGQHDAGDLHLFLDRAEARPNCLFVGERVTEGRMPAGNSFANRFSNFWFALQTGCRLRDTQNGFRLYPLTAMGWIRPVCRRYEAELELLVRAAWRGIPVCPVPVRVYYAPEGERVSHFRPGLDFLRISLLNTLLTLLAAFYGHPRMLCRRLFSQKPKT